MLRALYLFVLVSVAAPPAAQESRSRELAGAAGAYGTELIDSVPAAKKQPALIARLRRDADAEYRAKRYTQAIDDLTKAIAYGAEEGLVCLRLAQAFAGAENDHVQASAYNAYVKSADPVERGNALFLIGRDYDRHDKQKEETAAFPAGIAFTKSAEVAERIEQVKRLRLLPRAQA